FVQRVDRLVAPEARLLEAAEGRGDVAIIEAIDPDDSGPERARGLEGLCDVPGPHGSRQAIDRVIADLHRLLAVLEGDGREHWPEDLLVGDRHLVVDMIEDCRLHIVAAALVAGAHSAEYEFRALALALVDIAKHPLHLSLVHNRAHGGFGIEGIAR